MDYNNPIPVAVCMVPVVDGAHRYLLGIVRATAPGLGGVAYAGGYLEENEDASDAASRELLEETTLDIAPRHWHARYTRVTPNNRLLIFMVSDVELTIEQVKALPATAEVSAYRLLDQGSSLVFPLHQQVNEAYWQTAA